RHAPALGSAAFQQWVAALADMPVGADDAERIDRIRALEGLKSACAAAQARETVAFVESQERAQRQAGVPAARVGAGVAAQVALARRESPHRGNRLVGLAKALVSELPHTMQAMAAGASSEWRAVLIAKETACLSREHRLLADAELHAGDGLTGLGDRQVEAAARRVAYRLDPAAVVERARNAVSDRRVSLRPAPDTMTWLTALLPMPDGVAVHAALTRAAESARAHGDPRGRGQVMADTLVSRVTGAAAATTVANTGHATSTGTSNGTGTSHGHGHGHGEATDATTSAAAAPGPAPEPPGKAPEEAPVEVSDGVPVELLVVMTDQALLGFGEGADEPVWVHGQGPVPAGIARDLLRHTRAAVFLRRLYADPTGRLVSMDSTRRTFSGALRKLLIARDQSCRTPWCGAPIRHLDHIEPVQDGGATRYDNGQGLCEACNHAKQSPGWSTAGDGEHTTITTPTGHAYESRPPTLPGVNLIEPLSPMEKAVCRRLAAVA
ncbi:MAG TPA: DUF222 domain-containing protein, partial [Dermatophilaceae bacterium]|nr:DUF222 domain-containing protein [Dermatophilaceae bacterium]